MVTITMTAKSKINNDVKITVVVDNAAMYYNELVASISDPFLSDDSVFGPLNLYLTDLAYDSESESILYTHDVNTGIVYTHRIDGLS